jgi:hypothetical protein
MPTASAALELTAIFAADLAGPGGGAFNKSTTQQINKFC